MAFVETMETSAVPTLVRALSLAGSVPTLGDMRDIMCVHRLVDYYPNGGKGAVRGTSSSEVTYPVVDTVSL